MESVVIVVSPLIDLEKKWRGRGAEGTGKRNGQVVKRTPRDVSTRCNVSFWQELMITSVPVFAPLRVWPLCLLCSSSQRRSWARQRRRSWTLTLRTWWAGQTAPKTGPRRSTDRLRSCCSPTQVWHQYSNPKITGGKSIVEYILSETTTVLIVVESTIKWWLAHL